MKETQIIKAGNWVMRVRLPVGDGPYPALFLLHGLTGDENAMWVFASRLPENYLVLAPRAPHRSPLGGYSWNGGENENELPKIDDFFAPADSLLSLISTLQDGTQQDQEPGETRAAWDAISQADFSKVSLVGFSQGAALAYTFALLHPERVSLVAGLAGFLPTGADSQINTHPLVGKQVYVTHGTKDDMVPVRRAHQAVELLRKAGAEVTYCEEAVGHKLSAACFRTLGDFFSRHS
jgi:phospholipase/carboxylesterase